MTRFALPLFFVLLAGCARSEEAEYTQVDNNASLTVERALSDADDDELAIGAWRMSLQDDQSVLEFGPSGAAPVFSLGCDARRNLLLQRHGAAPAGDLPVMLVTVGSETRRLAVVGAGGAHADAARDPAGQRSVPRRADRRRLADRRADRRFRAAGRCRRAR